jgi:hypothetical protein
MENIDFDSMSLAELWEFRNVNLIQVPMLAALITADTLRQREGNIPEDQLIKVPVGRSSFTTYTKEFETQFRDALKDLFKSPLSRQTFENLRQRILKMSLQELVEWNALQNLLSKEDLDVLFAAEDDRTGPKTESLTRNGCSMSFTEQHTLGFRAALMAALDQKEKDFVNERSS